jgi:hypothetical protein
MELSNSSTLDLTPHETRQEDAETNPQHEYAASQNIFACISLHLFVPTDKLYFILMFK